MFIRYDYLHLVLHGDIHVHHGACEALQLHQELLPADRALSLTGGHNPAPHHGITAHWRVRHRNC